MKTITVNYKKYKIVLDLDRDIREDDLIYLQDDIKNAVLLRNVPDEFNMKAEYEAALSLSRTLDASKVGTYNSLVRYLLPELFDKIKADYEFNYFLNSKKYSGDDPLIKYYSLEFSEELIQQIEVGNDAEKYNL